MAHMHPLKKGSVAQMNASLGNGTYVNEVALWVYPLGVTTILICGRRQQLVCRCWYHHS